MSSSEEIKKWFIEQRCNLTIENLKKNMLKNINIEFTEIPSEDLTINGVVNFKGDGLHVNFMFDGNINELMKHLSNRKISNISIEEPGLDEIFMHFYKNHGVNNVN